MPFHTTKELPPNPAIRVFFSGQMIIRPAEDGESCEVFVNRVADNHVVSVEVREKREGHPDAVLMRYFGPFAPIPNQPINGLRLQAAKRKGLRMYAGGDLPTGESSLELALDLTDKEFHDQPLEVNTDLGRPSIFVDDGFFYTAEKTPDAVLVTLNQGGKELRPVNRLANLIGCNIYQQDQDDDDFLTMNWMENGAPKVFELKPPNSTIWEVYILNEPLFINPTGAEEHDELKEFYKILTTVPPQDQFKFEVDTTNAEKGTPHTLCMTMVIKR